MAAPLGTGRAKCSAARLAIDDSAASGDQSIPTHDSYPSEVVDWCSKAETCEIHRKMGFPVIFPTNQCVDPTDCRRYSHWSSSARGAWEAGNALLIAPTTWTTQLCSGFTPQDMAILLAKSLSHNWWKNLEESHRLFGADDHCFLLKQSVYSWVGTMEKMRKSMVELWYPLSGQTHARFHKHSIPPSNRHERRSFSDFHVACPYWRRRQHRACSCRYGESSKLRGRSTLFKSWISYR